MSSSAGGSAPLLRRGLISCLHCPGCCRTDDTDASFLSDQHLPEAIYNLIVGFYDEAFHRLPTESETMPDLLGLLTTGGFCLGLLDPVSNIILNTIALLPKDDAATTASSSSPPAAKRARSNRWHMVATMSYQSLLAFLMAYFGCLTKVQAIRYLYRANANVHLAVMLVQHDLYYAEGEGSLDPESDRTQAALKWAATTIGHPSPSTLARLMAIRLKKEDFDLLEKKFSADGGGTPLTAEDVRAIHRILHMMMSPMCVANIAHTKEGLVVHVRRNIDTIWSVRTKTILSADTKTTSTAFCWDGTPISSVQLGLPNKLQDCLRIADGQKHILKTPCGDACNYLQSLEMYLYGMIHNMYIKALKLLPTPSGSLMRSILMAGHCYGSMDPVSNIIVNSIWYDTCGSVLPLSDRRKFAEYNDVLDPLSLLRLAVRSLEGLAKLALFADPQSTISCAMEKLCSAKCVIAADMLSSARERSETNPFHEAAMAAGHPLPLELGELHRLLLLMPDERSTLLSFITKAQTSGGVLNVDGIMSRMTAMWSNRSEAKTSGTVQAPELCEEALRVVSNKRSQYEAERSWFRSKIEKMLQDYADQHFWEPKYTLDFICGVEEREEGPNPHEIDTCYHVNFIAAFGLPLQKTLFYAEFWCAEEPKPNFCCPLSYPYAGRCYYGVHSATKIVYPDRAEYIPHDITSNGTGSVDGMLEMDLVYFSSERDVELAKNLNVLPSKEEYIEDER